MEVDNNESRAISAMRATLAAIPWDELTSGRSQDDRDIPLAYAMFQVLVRDLGQSGPIWHDFLKAALDEVIWTDGGGPAPTNQHVLS